MLQRVHTKAGAQQQNCNDEHGAVQLLTLAVQNLQNDREAVIVGIDAEQSEQSQYAEQSEGSCPTGEEDGQVIGQEADQVNQALKALDISPQRFVGGQLGIQVFGCPQTQYIVQGEKCYRCTFDIQKNVTIGDAELFKGVENAGGKVDDNGHQIENVIRTAYGIFFGADLQHVKQLLQRALVW